VTSPKRLDQSHSRVGLLKAQGNLSLSRRTKKKSPEATPPYPASCCPLGLARPRSRGTQDAKPRPSPVSWPRGGVGRFRAARHAPPRTGGSRPAASLGARQALHVVGGGGAPFLPRWLSLGGPKTESSKQLPSL
jgi:hypothetical protein